MTLQKQSEDCTTVGVVSGQNVNLDRKLGEKGRENVSILIYLFITRIL